MVLTDAEVAELLRRAQEARGYRVTVDLERLVVRDDEGFSAPFTMDDFRRHCLMEGLDDIALTLGHYCV